MPKFVAEAIRNGKKYSGVFEAESEGDARDKLTAQGFKVLLCRTHEDQADLEKEVCGTTEELESKSVQARVERSDAEGTDAPPPPPRKSKITLREVLFAIGVLSFAFLGFVGYNYFYGSAGEEAYQGKKQLGTADQNAIIDEWQGKPYSIKNMLAIRKQLGRNVFTPKTDDTYTYIYFHTPHVTLKINKESNIIEMVLPGEH